MAKHTSSRAARSTRGAAATKFVPQKEEEGVQSENDLDIDGEEDTKVGLQSMISVVQEYQKRQEKQSSARAVAFRKEMKMLFAAAREKAQEFSDFGIAAIEQARTKAKEELRVHGSDPEKDIKDLLYIFKAHEEAMQSVIANYRTLFQELLPRRVKQIDATSAMMQQAPLERARSLRTHLHRGRNSLEAAKGEEKIATDAQELVKHAKALMLC